MSPKKRAESPCKVDKEKFINSLHGEVRCHVNLTLCSLKVGQLLDEEYSTVQIQVQRGMLHSESKIVTLPTIKDGANDHKLPLTVPVDLDFSFKTRMYKTGESDEVYQKKNMIIKIARPGLWSNSIFMVSNSELNDTNINDNMTLQ